MVLVILITVLLAAVTLRFLLYHLLFPDVTCPVFMGGKTAVVTGGSSGLGYQIVLELASRGCKVIIADKISEESIKDEVIRKTNNPNILIHHLDLASFKSVRAFAEQLKKTEDKVDILFNNAGIGGSDDSLTEDGLNFVYQINYYGGFLLTHLILDLLKKSRSGRVLFTSSPLAYVHDLSRFDRKQITTQESMCNYPSTKCLNIICSNQFAEKLKQFNITSNAWHPIGAATPIFRKSINQTKQGSLWIIFLWIAALFCTPEPRRTILRAVYLACANEMEGVSGKFFSPSGIAAYVPPITKERQFCQQVWDLSEQVVQLRPEEKL